MFRLLTSRCWMPMYLCSRWRRFSGESFKVTSKFKVMPGDITSEKSLSSFTLAQSLESNTRDKAAITDGFTEKSYTNGELHARTYKFAQALQNMGFRHGDCIAIVSPNDLDYFTAFVGASVLGCVSTPVNPLYTVSEIEYQINVTSAKAVIVHDACVAQVQGMVMERGLPMITIGSDTAACPKQSHIPALEDLVSQITDEVGPDSFPAVHPDSTLTIPFSSGTTGLPKGVVLSHRNVTSNMLQLRIVEGDMSQKRLLNPLPFFHIYGLVCGLIYPVFACMPTVFMPSFDFVKCLEIIQKHKITSASLVPPIVLALAKHPLVDQYDLSSLERIGCGAAPLGSEIQHAAAKRLKCVIKQGWGMTELSPVGTVVPDAEANNMEELKGKAGCLLPGTEALIVDTETGKAIPAHQSGELLIRGPQVMQGYYKNPEATAATIRPDGFMHTGDIGFFDDMGWLQITDRIKELIKYKGFQVAPAELEALINTLPGVADVVVIPVLDDEAGEIPRAYVVRSAGSVITEQDVMGLVREHLSPHKHLRGGVRFVEFVPRAISGKLLRRKQVELDRASV